MPHGGDKQAVQVPRGTGKKLVDFLVFGAYLRSNQIKLSLK